MPFSPWQPGRSACAAVCALFSCAAAQAAGAEPLGQTLWLRAEAFHADINTHVRIDDSSSGVQGTEFAFERLGMPKKKTLPALNLGTRWSQRWRLELEYFTLDRTGRATLDENVRFDDQTFPVSAAIDSRLRSDVGRASLGYSFLHTPSLEVGAVAGVHVTRFEISMQSSVNVSGSPASVQRADKDATVPLPTVGTYGSWALGPDWMLGWRADFFSLNHRGYDGRLLNGQANLIYRATPHLALGGGLRHVDYKLRADRSNIKGKVDYRFSGPQLFVEMGF